MTQFLKDFKTLAFPDAALAKEITNPPIPVIFSHGLAANRSVYQCMGLEFASNGFITFLIDHDDGSNTYTAKMGEPYKSFNTNQPYFAKNFNENSE